MSQTENCKRCKKEVAIVKSRKEPFCNECFVKFVSLKQRKRMMGDDFYRECFKVTYNKDGSHDIDNVMLAMDFQSSTVVALDVITQVLREQQRQHRGKVGFQLDIVTIYRDDEELQHFKDSWKLLKSSERYGDGILENANFHLLNVNTFFTGATLSQIVLHDVDFNAMAIDMDSTKNYTIADILAMCPNRNTRSDFWGFIVKKIIKKFSYQSKSHVIIWGHSMTKLADQILGLVIKGRGAQIAESLDSEAFDEQYDGSFKNLYPMKDILLSEIDAFCIITGLDKFLVNYKAKSTLVLNQEIESKKSVNSMLVKNMTINELVRKYFDDIESEYSNIIATVLRTGDKLESPVAELEETEVQRQCSICSSPIYSDPSKWLRSITVIKGHPVETEEEKGYYEQWRNSKVGIETEEYLNLRKNVWDNGRDIPLCYGCVINLNGIKGKNIVWPKTEKEELDNILDEYQLTDDEDN